MALSVRTINSLEVGGIIMAKDLLKQTYESLMGLKNFGEKTLDEVRAAIRRLGLEAPTWRPSTKPARFAPRSRRRFSDFW